jgi:hypothetical protein
LHFLAARKSAMMIQYDLFNFCGVHATLCGTCLSRRFGAQDGMAPATSEEHVSGSEVAGA